MTVTPLPADDGTGAMEMLTAEQGLELSVYWTELKASQRPMLFPEVPVLFESRAQTATIYAPPAAPLVFHSHVPFVE